MRLNNKLRAEICDRIMDKLTFIDYDKQIELIVKNDALRQLPAPPESGDKKQC